MGTLWAVGLWDQLENHYCTPGVPALCWGPQCSRTAFIKVDKSSQQNEIVAFSWYCILTLGLPDLWAENRNKHVGLCWTHLDTGHCQASDAPHSFILLLRLVYQISNEDNKACGAGVFMRPYLEFSPRQQQDCHIHRRVTRLDLVKSCPGLGGWQWSVLSISYRISVSHCHSLQSILAT